MVWKEVIAALSDPPQVISVLILLRANGQNSLGVLGTGSGVDLALDPTARWSAYLCIRWRSPCHCVSPTADKTGMSWVNLWRVHMRPPNDASEVNVHETNEGVRIPALSTAFTSLAVRGVEPASPGESRAEAPTQ